MAKEIIQTTIDIGIAAIHLFLRFSVLYFAQPIMPSINPTIGIKKENTSAHVAREEVSPFSSLIAVVDGCTLAV